MTERPNDNSKLPGGLFGFLVRLRKSGVLRSLPHSWLAILLALYTYRNEQGFAWPSQATLAEEAGTRVRTVKRFVGWARYGLGVKVEKKGRGNKYWLPLTGDFSPWVPNGTGKRKTAKRGRPGTPILLHGQNARKS